MWNMIRKGRWSERRSNGRTPAPDLDVSYSTELEQKKVRIKDISSTGMYMLTDDRPQPGTNIELTLQKAGATPDDGMMDLQENESRSTVRVRARAVRVGEDGVGVVFEEERLDAATWSRLMSALEKLTGETDQVKLIRSTKALAFAVRISPAAEKDILEMVASHLSLEHAARAIEIALKAEEMASAQGAALRTDLPPELVLRILQDGSKVDEESTRTMWTELLATASYEGSDDAENLEYSLLLTRIDPVQMRIVDAACKLAYLVGWDPGFVFHQDLHCGAEDIKKISHVQNLTGIERDLNHLFELGLLEQTDRPAMCQQVERVNLTPTSLALKLYARCHGLPAPPVAREGAVLSKAS
jgi:hypothetical protein